MNQLLSEGIKVTAVSGNTSAGTGDVASDIIDMQGFDGVLFLAILGDVANTSVLALTADANSVNSASGMTKFATTADFTADATSADNKLLMLDCQRPPERYVRAALERGTANAAVNGIIAIQYTARNKPTSQHASVIAAAAFVGAVAA